MFHTPQCGNLSIFLPFRFYVKSIHVSWGSKSANLIVSAPSKLGFSEFVQWFRAENDYKSKFIASEIVKIPGFDTLGLAKVNFT